MAELNELTRMMLDEQRSGLQRAIDLYEFQVAVFYDSSRARRQARRFAAIKMMEHLEKTNDVAPGNLLAALSIDGYEKLLAEAFHGSGGWLSLRRLPSDKSFAKRMATRVDEARIAADVIKFLCAWRVAPPDRSRASYSKALFTVRTGGKTVAAAQWRLFARWSILVHLLLDQHTNLLPPKLNTVAFSERLVSQAQRLDDLRSLFADFNSVCGLLKGLDVGSISTRPLLPDIKLPPSTVRYEQLSDQVISKLSQYRSGLD
jgi:hypothetical protein